MTARLIIGDVREVLATLPDGSVDAIVTSPPFLALRSYLPPDHPDKALEIGSEATPAEFLDVMLALTAEFRRVLAPHGSIAIELGDTYAGSGGAGGDYGKGGLREGQPKFRAGTPRWDGRPEGQVRTTTSDPVSYPARGKAGWPLDKSLCFIPELYGIALAYGLHPLTGQPSPAGRWRVRNKVAWCLDGDTVVYARTPKGEGPTRLLHLAQNWQPDQWELWDGQRWTKVLGWSSTEADDAIEIEFRNGERISATRNHEWPTQRGLVRTDELTVGDVVESVTLPEPERGPVEGLPDEEVGWFLGTFLADGAFDSRDRIQIAGHIDETAVRLPRLRRLAEAYDGTASAHHYDNTASIVVRSPILAAAVRRYLGGTSARNKSLRAAAWRRSNAFLDALLHGYLEGDGHWDAKNQRWRLGFTDNGWLARDLRVLAARLGYRCRVKRHPRAADPRGGRFAGTARFYYRGEIRTELTRNLAPIGEVVALRPSKRRRFFDVGVEGEPHLFALGSGILTHNCRPNPPVGALGDKFRPATSYVTVACTARDRWFDLEELRTPHVTPRPQDTNGEKAEAAADLGIGRFTKRTVDPAGAPPLDWWNIPTQPYRGSHWATFPEELPRRLILAMCPLEVCVACGKPRRRVVGKASYRLARTGQVVDAQSWEKNDTGANRKEVINRDNGVVRSAPTLGWTDCGCGAGFRPGVVLDPFAGSGTTLTVAQALGRDAIGIDLDERNADLCRQRVGMFLTVEHQERVA